jgi:hypothetical protein
MSSDAEEMWKLRSNLGLSGIVGHIVIWALFSLVTCGFALFLFPYSFGETLINSTVLVDQHGRAIGKLRCTQGAGGHILHALGWWTLAFITCGVAAFFYIYRVGRDLVDATVVDSVS